MADRANAEQQLNRPALLWLVFTIAPALFKAEITSYNWVSNIAA